MIYIIWAINVPLKILQRDAILLSGAILQINLYELIFEIQDHEVGMMSNRESAISR
jgi:hypothetical protein